MSKDFKILPKSEKKITVKRNEKRNFARHVFVVVRTPPYYLTYLIKSA